MAADSRSARQSNIELLRILAMLAIIANHAIVHGHAVWPAGTLSVNRLWGQLIQVPGFSGVDAFVLISGYFLLPARSLRTSRIVKLWAQIAFYSMLLYALFIVCGAAPLRLGTLFARLTPITSVRWWFASTYFILYLLTPWLNRLLNALDKRQYVGLLALLGLLWCVVPTLEGAVFQSVALFQNNHLPWFVFLYALGGYLRRFDGMTAWSGRRLLALAGLCLLMIFLTSVVLALLGRWKGVFAQHALFLADLQTLPSLAAAVLLFLGLSRLDVGAKPAINRVSSAMFGVYLIHDDELVRALLWEKLLPTAAWTESVWFIPLTLLAVAAVFVCCTAIELARIRLVEQPCLPLFERAAAAVDRLRDRLLDRFAE